MPGIATIRGFDAIESTLREAKIAHRSVDVADDETKGLVLSLALEAGSAHDAARQVLGRFPFPFSLV